MATFTAVGDHVIVSGCLETIWQHLLVWEPCDSFWLSRDNIYWCGDHVTVSGCLETMWQHLLVWGPCDSFWLSRDHVATFTGVGTM